MLHDLDKLRVLIPHWIEHNDEHSAEFRQWVEQAGDASSDILAAAEAMTGVNASLAAALEKLGGPLEYKLEERWHLRPPSDGVGLD
jgi:hypothetical protein